MAKNDLVGDTPQPTKTLVICEAERAALLHGLDCLSSVRSRAMSKAVKENDEESAGLHRRRIANIAALAQRVREL